MAHVVNKDTKRSEKLIGIQQKWVGADTRGVTVFSGYFAYRIIVDSQMYFAMSSRHYEILADNKAKKFGNPQIYVNALAKTAIYGLFTEYPVRELCYDLYENDTPCTDVSDRYISAFKKYLNIFEDKWNRVLRTELPARVNSHPTFRERMAIMEISDYDYNQTETNEAFIAEQRKLRGFSDSRLVENKEGYKEARKVNYLDIKQKLEEYEAARANGRPLSESALLEYSESFYPSFREISEKIVDEVLAKTPDSAYANLQKGILLAEIYDDGCVEYFKKAAASNYLMTDAAMQRIGIFALKSGNQQLLDEYRADFVDAAQKAYELEQSSAVKKNDTLVPNMLPAEALNEIVVELVKIGKGNFIKIYTAAKYHKNGDKVAVFLIIPDKSMPIQNMVEAFNETYSYLTKRAENCAYELYTDKGFPTVVKKIKDVENSLIFDKHVTDPTAIPVNVFDEIN